MSYKSRLKKTCSDTGMKIFILLMSLCVLCIIIAIIIGGIFDPDFYSKEGMTLFLVALGSLIFLAASVIILIICNKKDKKLYGKGRFGIQFEGLFAENEKGRIINFLTRQGFYINEQKGVFYCTRTVSGLVGQHLGIFGLNGRIELEAFCTMGFLSNKESGLYGTNGMVTKYGLRKIVAQILEILNAPHDVTV